RTRRATCRPAWRGRANCSARWWSPTPARPTAPPRWPHASARRWSPPRGRTASPPPATPRSPPPPARGASGRTPTTRPAAATRPRPGELLAALPDANAGYVMKCRCVPSEPGGTATVVDHLRLFRNDPKLRWKYRVHEQILPAIRQSGGEVRWADVTID